MKPTALFGRLIALATIAAACMLPIEARAAMAVCEKPHAGDAVEDKSELAAKKRALESWVAGVSRLGEQYARWGIAWNRQLDCVRKDSGLFRCKAVGHPCTIRQVPMAPGELTPLRRGTNG